MNIYEGTDVDLIEPFPIGEAKRVFGWMHCYKNIIETDESPKTPEAFEARTREMLQYVKSYGVIDKNHKLNLKHEAPLIGVIIFEPAGLRNGYFHVASTRRAWGSRLIDAAGAMAIEQVFKDVPELTRVSAWVLEKNYPARGLLRRLNFVKEGLLEDLVVQEGQPVNCLHYGLTRRSWECLKLSPSPSESVEACLAA